MSDFYSRCLWCNIDLPRGLAFCTPTHREWWTRQHNREATAVEYTDEIGNADVREETAVRAGGAVEDTRLGDGTEVIALTARLAAEREHRLRNTDHNYCQCDDCRPDI